MMRVNLIAAVLLAASATSFPAAAFAGTATTSAGSGPRFAIDDTAHNTVEISCPAAAVWPYILNSNAWTQLKLLHRDGPTGQVGEIFAMVDPEKPAVILHLVENIEVVPDQRRTFKIYDLSGPLRGYVIWTLKKTGDRTVVSYDIYYESVLSLLSHDEIERRNLHEALTRRGKGNDMEKVVQSQLSTLKRLVESKCPGGLPPASMDDSE